MASVTSIFISYRHCSEAVVACNELCGRLKPHEFAGQIEVMVDHNLRVGDQFDEKLQAWLDKAHIFVILANTLYFESNYCIINELHLAMSRNIIIVPILLHDLAVELSPLWDRSWTPIHPETRKLTPLSHWGDRKDVAWTIIHKEIAKHFVDQLVFDLETINVINNGSQRAYLHVSDDGLKYVLIDFDNPRNNVKWRISPKKARYILKNNEVSVSPKWREGLGLFSIGDRRDWVYSHGLFSDSNALRNTIVRMLEMASRSI
jgi:hypothetical protein